MKVSEPFDRIIIGTVVTSDFVVPGGYVALRGETIAAIGAGVSPPAAETVDYGENSFCPDWLMAICILRHRPAGLASKRRHNAPRPAA